MNSLFPSYHWIQRRVLCEIPPRNCVNRVSLLNGEQLHISRTIGARLGIESLRSLLTGLISLWLFGCWGATLEFDQDSYQVRAGQSVEVKVALDAPPTGGLASYGFRLLHDAGVVQAGPVTTPAALNYFGVNGPGNLIRIEPDFIGIKGTVDFFAGPDDYYHGTLLAAFKLTFPVPGDYTLSLDLFNTVGPTEDIFVTGGTFDVLDGDMTFGPASVHVVEVSTIPEPRDVLMLMCGFGLIYLWRRCSVRRAAK